MICTGTGSAPMRAMTDWRRRLRASGKFEGSKRMLFFGARTKEELPCFGPLQSLPKDFIDIHLAFSRTAGAPKRYVQDLMRERAADLGELLKDGNTCLYVCGLKAMEEGVLLGCATWHSRPGCSGTRSAPRSSAKAGCTSRRTEQRSARAERRYPARAMSAAPGRPKQANAPSGGRGSCSAREGLTPIAAPGRPQQASAPLGGRGSYSAREGYP